MHIHHTRACPSDIFFRAMHTRNNLDNCKHFYFLTQFIFTCTSHTWHVIAGEKYWLQLGIYRPQCPPATFPV